MALMERYQAAVEQLLGKVRATQTEKIIEAGKLIADSVASGGKIYLSGICHSIEMDFIYRGGGPIFYKKYKEEEHRDALKAGDVLSVRGTGKFIYEGVQAETRKGRYSVLLQKYC